MVNFDRPMLQNGYQAARGGLGLHGAGRATGASLVISLQRPGAHLPQCGRETGAQPPSVNPSSCLPGVFPEGDQRGRVRRSGGIPGYGTRTSPEAPPDAVHSGPHPRGGPYSPPLSTLRKSPPRQTTGRCRRRSVLRGWAGAVSPRGGGPPAGRGAARPHQDSGRERMAGPARPPRGPPGSAWGRERRPVGGEDEDPTSATPNQGSPPSQQ